MAAFVSSRTPEGIPYRCPTCGETFALAPSIPTFDVACPSCGCLVWIPKEAGHGSLHADIEKERPLSLLVKVTAFHVMGSLLFLVPSLLLLIIHVCIPEMGFVAVSAFVIIYLLFFRLVFPEFPLAVIGLIVRQIRKQ
jgi:DNA-directed RNA polymerase subunit RPC12/RpoP